MRKRNFARTGGSADKPHQAWLLDPLEETSGGKITVERVALVRIACVAAETGARLQRDGLAHDPLT